MNRTLLLPLALLAAAPLVHCGDRDDDSTQQPGASDAGGTDSDAGPTSTCVAPTGAGTEHRTAIAASEVWKAAEGPHVVTAELTVQKGATLTLEPCAEVRLQKGASLIVEGNLVARGAETTPITIDAADPAQPWGFVQIFAPGTASLAYATVSHGGGTGVTRSYAMIEARGDQYAPAQEILEVDHVTVAGSGTYGVSLRAGAAFTKASQALTVKGAAIAPLRILPRLASNVPSGDYTGNTLDAIVVETESYGEVNVEDVTFHDRGVPYRVGGDLTFGELKVGPKDFALTLEAGVKLAFKKNGALRAVDGTSPTSTGRIVAAGTAQKPVVFTSAAPAPAAGDWVGIQVGKVPAAFRFDHVEIRYAGGPSQSSGHHCQPNPTTPGQQSKNDDAALAVYHQPASAFLTNSVVADSAGDGVDLAYTGSYVDFKATNSFSGLASCPVTLPLPTTGTCPQQGCP